MGGGVYISNAYTIYAFMRCLLVIILIMKKLLLITLLFLITPDAKADMDYVCTPSYASPNGWLKYIKENCE